MTSQMVAEANEATSEVQIAEGGRRTIWQRMIT
jgi:hypothetical protein